MTSNSYFWQGGRKIAIEHSENDITLQASNLETAKAEAEKAGVLLENMGKISPQVVVLLTVLAVRLAPLPL